MIDHFIAKVPKQIWAEGLSSRQPVWEASYNVAGWVKTLGGQGQISLIVEHEDGAGTHRTLVDNAHVTRDGDSLLSSQVRLRFKGQVKSVKLLLQLENDAMKHQMEELYMQRHQSKKPTRKLISNF